jgi:hypothetical protein
MQFRYFLGIKGISYDGWRRECVYYAGLNICANYLIRAFVSHLAYTGNGRHTLAVATKCVSKNFI